MVRRFQVAMRQAATQAGDPHHALAASLVDHDWPTDGTWSLDTQHAIAEVLHISIDQVPHAFAVSVPAGSPRSSGTPAPSGTTTTGPTVPTAPPPRPAPPPTPRPSSSSRPTPVPPPRTPTAPVTPAPAPTQEVHGPVSAPDPERPAATPEEIARAHSRELYDQGQQHFAAGEYQQALEAYESSHTIAVAAHLDTAPRVLLAIASMQERLGHTAEALSALNEYLAEVPNAPDAAEVEARITRLEPQIDAMLATPPGRAAPSRSPSRSTGAAPRTPSAPSRTPSSSDTTFSPDDPDVAAMEGTSPSPSGWYRQVGGHRYDVNPDDAQHLAHDLSQYLASAGAHPDEDRIRVFQHAAGIGPDGSYGGVTRSALIFWGVSNPPRALANPSGTYSPPRLADGTSYRPVVVAGVAAPRPDRARARRLASTTNRALVRRPADWMDELHAFQEAAGLPIGTYDGRTYNALVHFGIRRPPTETNGPAHNTPAAAYRPAKG
jgi:tetratricopeptide (TPR) repeat protein